MTPKQEAALRLALDCVSTLANARDWVGCTPNERWDEDEMYAELCNATICLKKSLSIIQEALAEQPAQQEPVAWVCYGATVNHHDIDFDQNEIDAIPLGTMLYTSPQPAQPSKPLTDEQRKAIVVCFTSGKVSVSEVQRKLAISYNEAQQLCQSIVDLGLAQGLQLAPSLDRHGIKGEE